MLEGRSLYCLTLLPYQTLAELFPPIPSRQQNPKRDNYEILIGFIISWSIPPELHGFLKFQDVSKWWRGPKFFQVPSRHFSTTSPCCGRHFQVFFGRIPTLKTALQRKDAEMQQLSKVVRLGIGTTPASPSQHLSLSTQKDNKKKPKALADTDKNGGFFSRWRVQDCPKMVDYVLFIASFHPFLAGCFRGSFLDNPHLKLPNKQLNTGRGGKRTSMAARSSERVTL